MKLFLEHCDLKAYLKPFGLILLSTIICSGQVFASPPPPASNTTAPYKTTYTAKLMNASSVPITTSQDIRFSLWSSADWTAANFDVLGNIDILSPNYGGWQETHTVVPNSDGIFTVELGGTTIFPNFTSATHVYLEVDVKPTPSALTAFEVLDPIGTLADTTDRKSFNSTPYAVNADTVDNRDAGNGPNNIPILDGTGKLIFGVLPDGVNANTFTLDKDDNSPLNVITLQFGQTLAKYLRWNNPTARFELSDSLNINGNLTFTGTAQITGATIDGTLNTFQNIPLAARAPYLKTIRLTPQYPNATLVPSGVNNNGRMITGYDDAGAGSRFNFYKWTTGLALSQNMDIRVRYQLPTDFTSFAAAPLSLTYQTADLTPANNSLTLTLTDSLGAAAPLTGGSSLTSAATWLTTPITFTGVPTFTAGTFIEFKLTAASINAGKYVKIGDLVLNYNGR